MSPIVNGQYVVPGIFSSVNQNVLPTAPGSNRIPALVGTGRTTNLVSNESVVRGATAYDALAHTATALSSPITDENFIQYILGTDYALGTGGNAGKVEWLTLAAQITGTTVQTFNGLVGKTIIVAVASGALQTYTFLTGDFVAPTAATALEVATAINSNITSVTA
jgi:hypothetical protein